MDMQITAPEIEQYIGTLYSSEPPILREMERLGDQIGFPIVGPLVGRFLHQLTKIVSAKKIFEMGSGFGYSAVWFALAIPDDGEIHLTDQSQKNLCRAKAFFARANFSHKARFHIGDALEILSGIHDAFDIIFIDIDKEEYPKALSVAKPKLNRGGLLITDNLLWFGQVLEAKGDGATVGVKRYNQLLFQDRDFISTLLPIRDGVGVAYKVR